MVVKQSLAPHGKNGPLRGQINCYKSLDLDHLPFDASIDSWIILQVIDKHYICYSVSRNWHTVMSLFSGC